MNMDIKRKWFNYSVFLIRTVQKKSNAMIKSVEKQGKLNVKIESALLSAQTMDELDHVFAPFKGEYAEKSLLVLGS